MSNPIFIDQPVVVEARLLPDGQIEPIAFAWQDRRQAITGTGRRWQEAPDGKQRMHYLVQTATSDVFELCIDTGTGQWRLLRAWLQAHQV
jgi:hypothetical protein